MGENENTVIEEDMPSLEKRSKKYIIPIIAFILGILVAVLVMSLGGGGDKKPSDIVIDTTEAFTTAEIITIEATTEQISTITEAETELASDEETGTEAETETESETETGTEIKETEDYDTESEGEAETETEDSSEESSATTADKTTAAQSTASQTTAAQTTAVQTTAQAVQTTVAEAITTQAEVSHESGSPYDNHGKLSVSGTNILDKNGNIYRLKGVSTHGIAWFPDYVNKDAFKTMRDEWGINVVRLAMYSAEYGGYCSGGDKNNLKNLVDKGVQAATELGLYVIIDWHVLGDQNPKTNQTEAVAFFKEMSAKYSDYDNVLYEICNEPNGGTTWSDVKEYANTVIPEIRANSDGIILVGSPTWSQDIDKALADPITGQVNIMYTLHFYAATHGDYLRNRMEDCIKKGLPVFISEYGICDASGNGGYDINSANLWMALADKYNVGSCIWNLSNKAETSSLIKSSVSKKSGWTYDELSGEGLWFVDMLGGKATGTTQETQKPEQTQAQAQTQAQTQAQETTTAHTHSFSAADCYNPERCSCGEVGKAALGHDFGNNQTCSRCGQQNPDYQAPIAQAGSGNCKVTCEGNGRGQFYNDAYHTQFNGTVSNTSNDSIKNWKAVITFNTNITIEQSWNGTFEVSGNTITVVPSEDWSATLTAGGNATFGFIVSSAAEATVSSAVIQ